MKKYSLAEFQEKIIRTEDYNMGNEHKRVEVFEQLRGGLIVSCQALEEEPLHSSYIMSRMAYAAKEGGARGIRANTPEDIVEIKKAVDLPIIGLYKQIFEDSEVYITPTLEAVDSLMEVQPEIIAMDATKRRRPGNITLDTFFAQVRKKYPRMLFMADCSCIEDAIYAQALGFNLVGTTLAGYTRETKGRQLPDFDLMRELVECLTIPVIAEGGIWTPEDLKQALECKVLAAVVGTAITRPREITKRFVSLITGKN